jgi:membrane-associated phospholipid phosphatase
MIKWFACMALILTPNTIQAQPTALDPDLQWSSHRKAADIISYAGPIASLTLDTIHSFRSDDKARAIRKQVIKDGLLILIAEGTKHFIQRSRPDNSDNKSFFSEHTELSASLYGSNRTLSIILTFDTAALRTSAGKHYLTDVLAGAVVGSVISEIMK